MRLLKAPFAVFFTFILLISFNKNSYSQTIGKFGIKGGFITTGLSTFNEHLPYTLDQANLYIYDNSDFFNFLSFDVGIYAELFNSEEFCVSTELHYLIKGETDIATYRVPRLISSYNGQNFWEMGTLIDKASFLSLQILPRYRAGISKEEDDNVYFFAGPVFNFVLANNGTYTQPKYVVYKGFLSDIGAAIGLGFEVNRKFMLELKLDYSLTGSYDFIYKNEKIRRSYDAFSVLTGFVLSELF
jgi:hypothetical protein